jgi:hypothetical protein
MAISTFAQLQTALQNYAHRDDTSFTDRIPEFIAMAEARMYDELVLKDMESEEDLTLTLDQNYVALPSGYVSDIALWLIVDSERVLLQKVLPQQLPYYASSTQPQFWAIDGSNIRFDYPAGEAYSAKFRMLKKSNLSDSNTTNALLTRRPDVYLAACMSEYARWAQDAEVFNTWESKYVKSSQSLKAADARSKQAELRTDIGVARRSNIFIGE